MRRIVKLISFIYFILVTSISLASGADLISGESTEECQTFLKGLPASYKRGFLTVPLDYSKPEGKKLKVFYFSRMRTSDKPVVFFNGGPGSPNREFGSFEGLETRFGLWMIYMDQRGTGCSTRHPNVVDSETAQITAHFGARNIVRDHEVLREHLLGKNSKWTIFGQSFGGWIVERYISMFPNSLEAAHNYGGASYPKETLRFQNGLRSQIKAFKKFYQVFPGSEEKMVKVKAMLTPDKCFLVDEENKVCGTAIVSLVILNEFYSENTWFRLNTLIDDALKCTHDTCLFLSNGDLNPKYWEQFKSQNKESIKHYWGFNEGGGPFNAISKIGQDQAFATPNNPHPAEDSAIAKKVLTDEGLDLDKLIPFSYLDVIEQAFNAPKTKERGKEIFKEIKVLEPWSVTQLRKGLLKNKKLKYHIYLGEFDGISNNPLYEKRPLPAQQVTIHRFENSGHWGYQEENLFWKILSGRQNVKMFAESAQMLLSDNSIVRLTSTRRMGGGKPLADLSAQESENNLVYVGLAIEPLTEEMAQKVKGKFALIDRGGASFSTKAQNVEKAGAVGLIIVNNATFPDKAFVGAMSDPPTQIPGIMISRSEGQTLKDQLSKDENLKVKFLWDDYF